MLSKTNQTSFNWTLRLDANRNYGKTFVITITTDQAEGGDRSSTRPSRLRGHGDGWRKTTTGAPSSPIAPLPPPPSNHLVQPPTSQPSTHPPPPNVKTDHFLPPTIHPVHFATFPPKAVCLYQYCVTLLWLWIFLIVIWSWNLDVSWTWFIAHARTSENCPFHTEWHFLSTELTLKCPTLNPALMWDEVSFTHHRSSRLKTNVLQNLRL